jgi:hypothetical protein
MAKITVLSKPNMSADITVSGLKILEVPKGWSFKVDIELDDKIIKTVQKDTILLQEFNTAALKAYEQTCTAIKSKYTNFEKLLQGMVDKGAPPAEVEKHVKGLNASIEQDKKIGHVGAEHAVQAVWAKWQPKQKEYLKYKIKIAVTIIGAAAGLAISIGLMAATPFTGGASAAFSIIGMFKSAVTLGKEIASAWAEIETSQKVLDKYMKAVEAIAKKNKALSKGNEYTAAVVRQFLGEAQPNIKGCMTQLETIEKKLAGLEVKTHNLGKTLNGILDEQEKLRDGFMKEVNARLGKHPSKEAPAQIKLIEARLDKVIEANTTKVQAAINKVMELYKRFKDAEKTTEDLGKRVEPLKELRGLDNKILENVIYFVDLPLGALNGNAFATQSADLVQGLVPVASSMAYDKISGAVLDKTLLV